MQLKPNDRPESDTGAAKCRTLGQSTDCWWADNPRKSLLTGPFLVYRQTVAELL
jgi:hypothetical protein